jgi:hypothetical protein
MLPTFCKKCGKQIADSDLFCWRCGKPRSDKQAANRRWLAFFAIFGVLMVVLAVTSNHETPDPGGRGGAALDEKTAKEARKQKQRNELDPPSDVPLSPRGHLERARLLLRKVDVEDTDQAFTLLQLIGGHVREAKEDARLIPQADAVMKRTATKLTEATLRKTWKSPKAGITAEVECKLFITARLKAPSSADWGAETTNLWADHPGYFLITYVVDAQNSFGAKLRNNYQCQVICISDESCEVKKMYDVEGR